VKGIANGAKGDISQTGDYLLYICFVSIGKKVQDGGCGIFPRRLGLSNGLILRGGEMEAVYFTF